MRSSTILIALPIIAGTEVGAMTPNKLRPRPEPPVDCSRAIEMEPAEVEACVSE